MWQRPQTIYLLSAGLLLVLVVLLGDLLAGSARTSAPWLGAVTYGLAAATAAGALIAVALFKDRARQRRVIGVVQWMDLGLVGAVLAGLALDPGVPVEAGEAATTSGAGRYLVALAPLVAYAFLRMARRGVDRDVAAVRSMDRLR